MSSPVFEPKPYIPSSLSEIYDQLGSMVLYAPTFIDPLGDFPNRNIDSEFQTLTEGFRHGPQKLGDDYYPQLMDLAARAKALFAADQDYGKTDEGRALLFEMEDVLKDVRNRRVQAKLPDENGEITGD